MSSNHINIDPFLGLKPDIHYDEHPANIKPVNMANLQSTLQGQLLGKILSNTSPLKTGDPMVDMIISTFIQTLIIGFVGLFVTKLGSIISFIFDRINCLLNYFFVLFYSILTSDKLRCRKNGVKWITRTVDIPYITDTKQINELYKGVFWFLTNDREIDYTHEPYLQYVFDKKITIENRNLIKGNININKILSQQKSKTVKYKGYDIKYSLSTEVITIHSDRDRKKENYKVTLMTTVNEKDKRDILEEFCQFCMTNWLNSLTASTWLQHIYVNTEDKWVSHPSNNNRKLDTIVLKNSLKDDIKNDLALFLNSEEWYKDRDIPYTRGYMFYGYPGTGKTTMIKGLSLFCKRHIHFLMLSNIQSDEQLLSLMKSINYKETILVIEDIDATLNIVKSRETKEERKDDDKKDKEERDKKKPETKLTLSGLLNCLDGVFNCDGRILIMTTNHPEVLDSALIRAGRIDSKYLFDNCDKNQISELYFMFFGKYPDKASVERLKNGLYSPAHITSVFLRYRNCPEKALENLDHIETKIVLPKLVE